MISHSDRLFQLILECNGLPVFKPQPRRAISSREHSTLPFWNIRSSAAIQPPFYLFRYALGCANVQIVPASLSLTNFWGCITPQTSYRVCFMTWQAGTKLRQHDREYQIKKKKKRGGNGLDLLKKHLAKAWQQGTPWWTHFNCTDMLAHHNVGTGSTC